MRLFASIASRIAARRAIPADEARLLIASASLKGYLGGPIGFYRERFPYDSVYGAAIVKALGSSVESIQPAWAHFSRSLPRGGLMYAALSAETETNRNAMLKA